MREEEELKRGNRDADVAVANDRGRARVSMTREACEMLLYERTWHWRAFSRHPKSAISL
jgi:hypothetical protein